MGGGRGAGSLSTPLRPFDKLRAQGRQLGTSGRLAAGMRVDAIQNRLVPELTVSRLEDPMPFVRKPEEPGFDSTSLERGEHSQPLLGGDSKIQLALNHQSGRLEILGVAARAPPAIALRLLPVGTSQFELWKPELLGAPVHADQLEHSVVAYHTLESIRASADPVHHIPAEGSAGGTAASGLDVRQP